MHELGPNEMAEGRKKMQEAGKPLIEALSQPPIPDDVVEAAAKEAMRLRGLDWNVEGAVKAAFIAEAERYLTASGLLDKNKALEDECAALRTERDALLQKPLDLAKMDSIDDDDDTSTEMIAYYWHDQAQEARDKNKALREALESAATTLLAIRCSIDAQPWDEVEAKHFFDLCGREVKAINTALNSQQGEG